MTTPQLFPFTAIVGQEPMKRALVLNAIYPAIGGVLIAGEKGTAKSTAVRALATLLPEIAVVADCPYSCDPDKPEDSCPLCRERRRRGEILPATRRRVRMVELPVGATEDRLLGTLDLEAALQDGTCRFEPGLLAAAHRGILYVDEVNLLPDHLVDALLDVAASGVNVVEREGISFAHPARFILVGTMNPEEGELRPQFLDRFGITAEVLTLRDPTLRYEVVRRRLAFERDPERFRRDWAACEQEEAQRIQRAAALLPEVQLDEVLARSIAELCASAGVDGLRGDLVIHKAAMALATYAGRTRVTEEDVQEAAVLALAHRRRRRPFEPPARFPSGPPPQARGEMAQPPSDTKQPTPPSPGPARMPPAVHPPSTTSPPSTGEGRGGGESQSDGPEWHFAPRGDGVMPRLTLKSRSHSGYAGTRQTGTNQGTRGLRIGARPVQPGVEGSLALDATLRAAARWQPQRRRYLPQNPSLSLDLGLRISSPPLSPLPLGEGQGEGSRPRSRGISPLTPPLSQGEREKDVGNSRLVIRRHDLRLKVRRTPTQHLYILVVDASGSMAAYQRMAQVKGMLLGLLREVYRHRDGVAVIAFRGAQSELLLSPTRSPEAAQAFIEALPTGGRTPLAHALLRVEGLLTQERRRRSPWSPVLLLITDGRPNRGLTAGDPLRESLAICTRLAGSGLHAVVVDTEAGAVRLGLAARFAQALAASYVRLETLLREDRS
jgi:magnesium chelatase subunit D